MSKQAALSARLEIRVAPSVLALVDQEIGRLRSSDLMFGNRKPKQAAIVMTAIKAFMSMPEEDRDEFYDRFLPELDPASTS
jgi:hypothetical protein